MADQFTQPTFQGNGVQDPLILADSPNTLEAKMANLAVNGKKKKRSVRAYHSDFSTPVTNSGAATPNTATIPTPGLEHDPLLTGLSAAPLSSLPAQQANSIPHETSFDTNAGPDQNLSIPYKRFHDQLEYMTPNPEDGSVALRSFYTFENVVSPSAGTQVHTVDQGTASSKFFRSTMYNIPESEQLRAATKLPVAVTVRPFAPLLKTEDPIPVVDMRHLGEGFVNADEVGPIRCRRCRTYMNPSMQHEYGDKYTCNICLFPNNYVPKDYSSMINPTTNQRIDVAQRPELHKGVYDILVPPSYNAGGASKVPNSIHHVILIDITVESIKKNLPTIIADALRSAFFSQEEDKEVPRKFAILLFDKRIHFFNLSKSLDYSQISVCSDLDDPFIPFFEGLFANPEESRMAVEDALNHIEQLGAEDTLRSDAEPAFSVALRTAMLCLKEVGGGKITAILTALPSWGPGSLKFKDVRTQASTISPEVQKKIYSADSEYYRLLAKDFLKENVGLDCLVVSQTSVDLSNIGWLASVTGGSVFKWSNFNHERDAREFYGRLLNSITKTQAYQGQLKLRCSNGLQVAQYYGLSSSISETSIIGASNQDPVIPVLSEDSTFTILLEYDGKLSTSHDCHFQAAVLYTDTEGNRKVRVINLVLAVSERLDDVFNFVDQDAVVTTLVRDTLSFVGKQTFKELRESINYKLVEVFTQYRAKSELGPGGHRASSNQLLMPDSLVNLPLYMLAFLKSNALKESSLVSADARLEDIYQMLDMPIERLVYHLYPSLVELHSLYPQEGLVPESDVNPLGFVLLPQSKPLSLFKVEDSIYLLCDGRRTLLWIRPNANPLLIKDLFGESVDSVDDIDPLTDELPELSTEISQKTANIIKFFNLYINGLTTAGSSAIQIIRERIDGSDIFFKEHLIEDGTKMAINIHNSNYNDFLSRLHKAIKTQLENDATFSKVKASLNTSEKQDSLAQRLIRF